MKIPETENLIDEERHKPRPIPLEDVSPGLLCPEGAIVVGIPLCNVCENWAGPHKCKKLGESPLEYSKVDRRDCKYASFAMERHKMVKRFSELYPEDVKRLLEKTGEFSKQGDHNDVCQNK